MIQNCVRVLTRILLLAILSVQGLIVNAQFNDSITHYVNYTSSGVINKTNDGDSYVLNNNLRFNLRKKDISLNASGSWIYGEQNDRKSNNDFTSSLDFNLFKTFRHFYYWGLATYEKSFSLKIRDRYQAGLGGAYNVIEKPNLFLNLSEGMLLETSDLYLNDSTREKNTILRNSFRLRFRMVIREFITFDGTQFVQNSMSEGDDYILKSINTLSFKLYKWLNFTTALTYNKVNKTDRENLLITFGLTAEKYF